MLKNKEEKTTLEHNFPKHELPWKNEMSYGGSWLLQRFMLMGNIITNVAEEDMSQCRVWGSGAEHTLRGLIEIHLSDPILTRLLEVNLTQKLIDKNVYMLELFRLIP